MNETYRIAITFSPSVGQTREVAATVTVFGLRIEPSAMMVDVDRPSAFRVGLSEDDAERLITDCLLDGRIKWPGEADVVGGGG